MEETYIGEGTQGKGGAGGRRASSLMRRALSDCGSRRLFQSTEATSCPGAHDAQHVFMCPHMKLSMEGVQHVYALHMEHQSTEAASCPGAHHASHIAHVGAWRALDMPACAGLNDPFYPLLTLLLSVPLALPKESSPCRDI